MTAEKLRELLHYDPTTGVFTWRVSLTNSIRVGDIAGTTRHGYREILINGRCYAEHRLAWLHIMGEWPAALDHTNLNRSDNRWLNLRLASKSQNGANAPRRADNASGFKGVYWEKRDRKWRSQIEVNGKRIRLGRFGTPHQAYANYCLAARKHFGDFARCYDADMLIIPRKKFEERVLRNLLAATQFQFEEAA